MSLVPCRFLSFVVTFKKGFTEPQAYSKYGPHLSQCAELQCLNDSLFGLIDPENAGEGKVTRMTDSDTALCYSKVINIEPSLDAVSALLDV
jgi:hypothetical protein